MMKQALLKRGLWPEAGLLNPCLGALPAELAADERLRAIWDGLDPAQVWDSHAHLTGTGDGGGGIRLHRDLFNPFKPLQYLQRLFFLNASCASGDLDFVERLLALHEPFPHGYKTLLLAFDDCYDPQGRKRADRSAFVVPDAWAARMAHDYPKRLEWIASIHPYREDCVEALQQAVAQGARAVKWLPHAQGMDPASPLCDRFYQALMRFDLPLLSHAGGEKAVKGANCTEYGNPLRLRRPLELGVRVIVAHCASEGHYPDTDQRRSSPQRSAFELFTRLMDEAAYERNLLADISAITQINRAGMALARVLEREEWHLRLLNGSDYPLPGVMPLFSLHKLAADGLLAQADIGWLNGLRPYNPLLFDFAVKRRLRWRGRGLADAIFETRRHFEPTC